MRASPLPGPLVGLVGIRSTQETPIVRSLRSGAGLGQLFAVKDEPAALSLEHDHFALGSVVQDTKPVLPGFRGGDLLHVYNVQGPGPWRQDRAVDATEQSHRDCLLRWWSHGTERGATLLPLASPRFSRNSLQARMLDREEPRGRHWSAQGSAIPYKRRTAGRRLPLDVDPMLAEGAMLTQDAALRVTCRPCRLGSSSSSRRRSSRMIAGPSRVQ